MKRTSALAIALLIYTPLLFMQFSCGTLKEKGGMEISPGTVEKALDVLLLADKHKAGGIDCGSCHETSNPVNSPSRDQCLQCHEDYKEVAASYLDPHNAHHTSTNCGVCHHVHKPSEKICQGCHSFNVQAT